MLAINGLTLFLTSSSAWVLDSSCNSVSAPLAEAVEKAFDMAKFAAAAPSQDPLASDINLIAGWLFGPDDHGKYAAVLGIILFCPHL